MSEIYEFPTFNSDGYVLQGQGEQGRVLGSHNAQPLNKNYRLIHLRQ